GKRVGGEVLQRVHRRGGEVAFLRARAVSHVGRAVNARVPRAFVRVDLVEALVHAFAPARAGEDEEFGLWSEIAHVGDAGLDQVFFSAPGDSARVARIGRALHVVHVADDAERLG